jgi:hypothetical protein
MSIRHDNLDGLLGGGFCTESPYYRPNPDRFVGKEAPRHRRHRPLAAK